MAFAGYDSDRFVGKDYESFECIICSNVAVEPFECNSCGKLFCKQCITSWGQKSNASKCPNRCASSTIAPIRSKALLRLYNNLDIKCSNAKCGKVVKVIDLAKHQSTCLMPKCWNFEICDKGINNSLKGPKPSCSEVCSTLCQLQQQHGNKKAMWQIIRKFVKVARVDSPVKVGGGSAPSSNVAKGGSVGALAWDPAKTGGGINLSDGNQHCFLKEQSYLFRSVLANNAFTSGVHYWEILADNRTENELKIGVATSKDFDYNSAFCDYNFGFSFYGLGQLRHGSNASGPSYGKKFKKEGVLGVMLNMNTGVLAFALNGEYMGVAYRDARLTTGTIYPAVALLHCAGCKIRSGLSVPSYFKD